MGSARFEFRDGVGVLEGNYLCNLLFLLDTLPLDDAFLNTGRERAQCITSQHSLCTSPEVLRA